jgi:hypothetical protein
MKLNTGFMGHIAGTQSTSQSAPMTSKVNAYSVRNPVNEGIDFSCLFWPQRTEGYNASRLLKLSAVCLKDYR